MDINDLELFFDQLPKCHNSNPETQGGREFGYGEITPVGVAELLKDAQNRLRRPITSFVDLGSGSGKAVLTASVLYPNIQYAVGIELVEDRHRLALDIQDALDSLRPLLEVKKRTVFCQRDATTAVLPVACADVIWVSNTCFPDELNAELGALIDECARDGTLVYATMRLPLERSAEDAAQEKIDISVTWSPIHRAIVCEMIGMPRFERLHFLEPPDKFLKSLFKRWTGTGDDATDGCAESEALIHGDSLRAAIGAALLHRFPSRTLRGMLDSDYGVLAILCAEALARSPEGLTMEEFLTLHASCLAVEA